MRRIDCTDGQPCSKCKAVKPCSEYHRDKSKKHGHATTCKQCAVERTAARLRDPEKYARHLQSGRNRAKSPEVIARRTEQYAADKARVIELYGGSCACCGETEPMFLTLDHVNNDGAEHRATDSLASQGVRWHRRNGFVRDERFQLLCWNCNCAKGIHGACPHTN